MNDTERFPKPDVPWFHDLYGRWNHPAPQPRADGSVIFVHPSRAWDATARLAVEGDAAVCGEPHREAAACVLAVGHDGPHLAWSGPPWSVFLSLRRVALPVEVSL